MATNRIESSGASAEAGKNAGAAEASAAPAAAAGGRPAWLPLGITVLLMPVLAYATTTYLLVPKLQRSLGDAPAEAKEAAAPAAAAEGNSRGGGAESKGKEGATANRGKAFVQLNKVLVNVAGTMGTRFLVVNMTLVSRGSAFETLFKDNEPELRHVAITSLSSKSINDLEKPGAKNMIRSELIALFNSVLGNGAVQELYFTEFAIQ